MTMSQMTPEERRMLDANVRKVVGLAALRRMRLLVDEYKEDEEANRLIAKRALYVFVACAVFVTMVCLTSPQAVMAALRYTAGLVR